MSTDNKLKEIKLRLQLIMLLRKLNKIYAHDKAISSDEPKWITVHPHGKGAINKNGEDIKGTPVLLESETGEVLGGMGGKYNGVHISEACSKENTLNTQHDIKRGQMMRENPQKFAAEQKAREQKAQQHLKDLQDTAKKETAKEQQKAKEKQDQIKEKQDQAKETQTQEQTKSPIQNLSKTSTEHEINAALDSVKHVQSLGPLTKTERDQQVNQKLELIKSLYRTDNKTAAKAFAERVKTVGEPPKELKNIGEARDYFNKLLPNANFCLENGDLKATAQLLKGTYTMIKTFPALGKFITAIGDQATAKSYNEDVVSYVEQKKKERDRLQRLINKADYKPKFKALLTDQVSNILSEIKTGSNAEIESAAKALEKLTGRDKFYGRVHINALIRRSDQKGGTLNLKPDDYFIKEYERQFKTKWLNETSETNINEQYKKQGLKIPELERSKLGLYDTSVEAHPNTLALCSGSNALTFTGSEAKGMHSAVRVYNKYFDDINEINKAMTESVKSGYHPEYITSASEAVIIHELGHALDNALALGTFDHKPSRSKEFAALYQAAIKEANINTLKGGPYWSDKPEEFWAEAVAAVVAGDPSKTPPHLRKAYDFIIKKYQEAYN